MSEEIIKRGSAFAQELCSEGHGLHGVKDQILVVSEKKQDVGATGRVERAAETGCAVNASRIAETGPGVDTDTTDSDASHGSEVRLD